MVLQTNEWSLIQNKLEEYQQFLGSGPQGWLSCLVAVVLVAEGVSRIIEQEVTDR